MATRPPLSPSPPSQRRGRGLSARSSPPPDPLRGAPHREPRMQPGQGDDHCPLPGQPEDRTHSVQDCRPKAAVRTPPFASASPGSLKHITVPYLAQNARKSSPQLALTDLIATYCRNPGPGCPRESCADLLNSGPTVAPSASRESGVALDPRGWRSRNLARDREPWSREWLETRGTGGQRARQPARTADRWRLARHPDR